MPTTGEPTFSSIRVIDAGAKLPPVFAASATMHERGVLMPHSSQGSGVIATGDLREHVGLLVDWTRNLGLPLLVFPTDRHAAAGALFVGRSLVLLFQSTLSAPAVGTLRRAFPCAPILQVSAQPEAFDGVLWASSSNPQALISQATELLRQRPISDGALALDTLVVDPESGSVWRGAKRLHVPRAQFRLLLLLSRDPGRVFDRAMLCNEILGTNGSPRRIDWHVARLRAVLGPSSACIKTWPTGYSIVSPSPS
jgi:hypothetical protein